MKTPEEKAHELFRKFVIKDNRWSENEYTLSRPINELKSELFQQQWFAPKEMAIFHVDEILSLFEQNKFDSRYEYYLVVKQEIEKL